MVHIDSDNVGLYKDERLAVINNVNGPKLNRTRKNITDKFKSKGLSTTIETNLVETGFLGATFILSSRKYYSYNKPNNAPLHIHRESNHPPSFTKQWPTKFDKRISDLFCDESTFNNAKVTYKLVLKRGGYKSEMKFDWQPSTRRNRYRNICFNPPFSQNVKTNIRKPFFKLVQKNFPKIINLQKCST